MHKKIFMIAFLACICFSCRNNQNSSKNNHSEELTHENNGHSTKEENEHEHNEPIKIRLTAYSESFEIFAEADPFIKGKESGILAHFTSLPGFNPLINANVTARFVINGQESTQKQDHPVRPGIYSFEIIPEHEGLAEIIFEIAQDDSLYLVPIEDIKVYSDEHNAIHEAESLETETLNTIVFTKEQSWKIDFATENVKIEPFGEIIKTSALIESAPGDEFQVVAKINGIVHFSSGNIVEGLNLSSAQNMMTISGNDLASENSEVRYVEAKNNYENAKAEYERALKLSEDKIVSQKELLAAKNIFENRRAIYENLNMNFDAAGQTVASPMKGFLKQLFVINGEYVTAGQPLATISQNEKLILHAEVQQKYLPVLGAIHSANIRTLYNDKTYTLDELNGKIMSYGRTATDHNYLLPVTLQMDNKGSFIPGGFVELFLKTTTNSRAITVPNSSLLEEMGNYFLMVQLTPELFEKREVKIGASDGLRTEITDGLTGDERVVSKGTVLVKLAQSTGTLDAHSGHVH